MTMMEATDSLEDWLRQNALALARAVVGTEGDAETLVARTLTARTGRTVVHLKFNNKSAILKLFDVRSEEALNACQREAFALMSMKGTGMAPELLTYSENAGFLVFEFIEGETLDATLSNETLGAHAWSLGVWLSKYIAFQPKRTLDVDWFDYFSAYSGIITGAVEKEARALFAGHPVESFAIAKNDMHPSNFLLQSNGSLIGIDYERSRFKPVGWDILSATWVLMKRFPGQEQKIATALINGWSSVGTQGVPAFIHEAAVFFARQASKVDWHRVPYKP